MLETRKTIIVSNTIMEEKTKILFHAEEKFFREGFFKISMDEIASDLRMSKKTIYKHFPSKEELLKSLTNSFIEGIKNEIEPIIDSNDHAIKKIVGIVNVLQRIGIKMSEKWLHDIRIHQPGIWKKVEEFRTQMITKNVAKVFRQGIKEGFIVEVPPQIPLTIFMTSVRAIINPEFIMNNSFSTTQAVDYTFKILLNGIFTDRGRKAYKKLISQKVQV